MGADIIFLCTIVEACSKAFDKSLIKLQSDYNSFIDDSAKDTIETLFDVDFFDRIDLKDEKLWH